MAENKPAKSTVSNKTIIIVIIAVVLVVCLCLGSTSSLGALLFFGGNSTATSPTQLALKTSVKTPVKSPTPVDPSKQTWLVMFYLDADDINLEEDIYFDFNEIELAGSTNRVKMVAQLDRFKGGFKGDGNWTSARRYYITKDADLTKINSKLVADLGEVDMDNSKTLVDFADWAIHNYPADKYVLILSDHGMGWPGGWLDPDPSHSQTSYIHLPELDSAFSKIIKDNNLSQFELIGMDACLMSMLEVYTTLTPYSRYAVASEETEPSVGWSYSDFLKKLIAKPEMSGAELAKAIVDGYISKDQRIIDDKARARLLNSVYGNANKMTAEELASEMGKETTLSAVDLSKIPALNAALDDLLYAMKEVNPKKIADARSHARAFTNVFSKKYPSPYIDLAQFTSLVAKKAEDETISEKVAALQAKIKQAVIGEKHGSRRKGASGISVYFPVSKLYWDENTGRDFYSSTTPKFVKQTLWDDFLAFHYAKQDFGHGNPPISARVAAPGDANAFVEPLKLSKTSIPSNGSVNVQTDITGDQIAYIYLLTLLKAKDGFLIYNMDYIHGDESRAEDGVIYPVWNRTDGKIHINIEWQPAYFGISDGKTGYFAFIEPDSYAATPGENIYSVKGKYTFLESGAQQDARMFFYNYGENEMRNVIGFSGSESTGITSVEINPNQGDRFQILDTWIKRDNQGNWQTEYHLGWEMTFGPQKFTYGLIKPMPGEFSVGIQVEDMDGNTYTEIAPVTVTQ
jgi:hypothetical protein